MDRPVAEGNRTAYSEQSHRDLCLAIFDSTPRLEEFTTFKESQFDYHPPSTGMKTPLKVTLRIIGESHVLSAGYGQNSFTEILSCASLFEPSPAHIWRLNDAEMSMEMSCSLKAGSYKTSLSCLPLDHEEAYGWFGGVENYNSVIKHIFLSSNGTDDPFTMIGATVTERLSLVYRSIHTYPNEGVMALTESALNFQLIGGQ